MAPLGELAALGTATCWSAGSLLFTYAARRVGPFTLNKTRITFAFVLLAAWLLATRGVTWVPQAETWQVGVLALSGWVGLVLGDWAFFASLVCFGPRRATLLMTLAPPIAALVAFLFLGEAVGVVGLLGMALTLSGVAWVIRERVTPVASGAVASEPEPQIRRGVMFGALGALGQALGLVLSKWGMGDTVDPLAATAIRMGAATLGVWLLALVTGRGNHVRKVFADRRVLLATSGASLLGPVIGVWLSLVAIRLTQTGIAATIMAMTPVLVIPWVRLVYGERVSMRAVLGALVAVAGVTVLVIR